MERLKSFNHRKIKFFSKSGVIF